MREGVGAGGGDPAVVLLVGHVLPLVLELRDVGAGDERLIARASQDHHADGVVARQLLDVAGHGFPHLLAHRVAFVRLVEDDPADGAVLLHQELVSHEGLS